MSVINKHLVKFTTLALGLLIPASAAAQVSLTTPKSVQNVRDISVLIPHLFDIVVGVAGILFVVLLLLGGVQYLVSLGDEEAVTKARKLMLNAGIGLVIVLSSWAVGNYVLRLLGINVSLTGGTVPAEITPVGGGPAPTSGGGSPTTPGAPTPTSGGQSAELQAATAAVAAAQQNVTEKTAAVAAALNTYNLNKSLPGNDVYYIAYTTALQAQRNAESALLQAQNNLKAAKTLNSGNGIGS